MGPRRLILLDWMAFVALATGFCLGLANETSADRPKLSSGGGGGGGAGYGFPGLGCMSVPTAALPFSSLLFCQQRPPFAPRVAASHGC